MLLDSLLVSFITYLLVGSDFNWTGPSWKMSTGTLVIGWLYFALQEASSRRASIGKRVMGLTVVGEAGEQLSFTQASIRYFSKILSVLILFLGYFMMLFSDKKQTLHDKIAKTLVLNS